MTTETYYEGAQRPHQTIEEHHAWQESRREQYVRLAAIDPADEDEPEVWVDQMFAGAGLALRGAYQKPIKRGRGRPRKDDQNVYV